MLSVFIICFFLDLRFALIIIRHPQHMMYTNTILLWQIIPGLFINASATCKLQSDVVSTF